MRAMESFREQVADRSVRGRALRVGGARVIRTVFLLAASAAAAAAGPAVPEGVPPDRVAAVSRIGFGDPRLRPPGLAPPSVATTLYAPPPVEGVTLLRSPLVRYELSRVETTLKGMSLAANTAMLLGAMSATYDWWDSETSWWMIGGAAAAGALYGGTLGHESDGLRIDIRVRDDE